MYVHSNNLSRSDIHWVASIAIWNRNKIVMAVAICLWGVNAAFFIQCKLILPSLAGDCGLSLHHRDLVTVVAGVNVQFSSILSMFLSRPQLRAVWSPAALACANLNLERSAPNLIAIPVTDIALIAIMLVGLVRLRCHHGGRFGLAQILWRQVRYRFLPVMVLLIRFPFGRVFFGSWLLWWLRFRQW